MITVHSYKFKLTVCKIELKNGRLIIPHIVINEIPIAPIKYLFEKKPVSNALFVADRELNAFTICINISAANAAVDPFKNVKLSLESSSPHVQP